MELIFLLYFYHLRLFRMVFFRTSKVAGIHPLRVQDPLRLIGSLAARLVLVLLGTV